MTRFTHSLVIVLKELPQLLLFLALVIITTWLSDWFPKYIGHPEFTPLLTTVYMLILLIAFSHIARRILFHKMDFQEIGKQAMASPLGAGIVFFSMGFVLSVLILCFTLMLH